MELWRERVSRVSLNNENLLAGTVANKATACRRHEVTPRKETIPASRRPSASRSFPCNSRSLIRLSFFFGSRTLEKGDRIKKRQDGVKSASPLGRAFSDIRFLEFLKVSSTTSLPSSPVFFHSVRRVASARGEKRSAFLVATRVLHFCPLRVSAHLQDPPLFTVSPFFFSPR